MASIAIRREDKHEWERRVPLSPRGVASLLEQGIDVTVQPSSIRAFGDDAYRAAGAQIQEDVAAADVLFAVKEVPLDLLRKDGAYVFFSHTIKGQEHNLPLLRKLMDLGCTLIDYERIVDERGRRLVFFGRHAGLAGMVDTLSVLGKRMTALGKVSAFSELGLAHEYDGLDDVKAAVTRIGDELDEPLVVGFAGYGNVSQGAQTIFDLLPHEEIEPDELGGEHSGLVKVVFKECHLVERKEGAFELQEYYDHPDRYRSIFNRHLPHLSLLVNAIYWTEDYPRLVTKAQLRELFAGGEPKLRVIGDISCDIDGSIECTVKATTPGVPAYVYDPSRDAVRDGFEGDGVAMMTTDCLPCELPVASSEAFTDALAPFVAEMARARFDGAFAAAGLPDPIRKATILWRGEFTPDFAYMKAFL